MTATTFDSFDIHPSIRRGIADMGFTTPTPIQKSGIPPALDGRDVLACAMTGSGKTAAFLIPILQQLLDRPRGKTRALVLTPTRELAAQIVEHFQQLARHTRLRAAAVYGGVGMGPQEKAFRTGVDLLVACPGRLLDHFNYPHAKLADLEILVLDEVDRMLDMGFLPDVRRVLRHLPETDQHLFYSATLPKPILQLTQELLNDPVKIQVERPSKPADGITQALWPVREDLKRHLLLELLRRGELDHALVFTRTKHRANRLAHWLEKRGVASDRIHGNRSQAQRTKALASFKSGDTKVLVATDIAARGIDVEALSHVVNFDVPHLVEDYIHRIGRTARARHTGDAFTFVTPDDSATVRAIERAVGKRLPRHELDGFEAMVPADEPLEIPIQQRRQQMRAQRAEERRRAAAKAEARDQRADAPRKVAGKAKAAGQPSAGQRPARPQGQRAAVGHDDRSGRPVAPAKRRRTRRRRGQAAGGACNGQGGAAR